MEGGVNNTSNDPRTLVRGRGIIWAAWKNLVSRPRLPATVGLEKPVVASYVQMAVLLAVKH